MKIEKLTEDKIRIIIDASDIKLKNLIIIAIPALDGVSSGGHLLQ